MAKFYLALGLSLSLVSIPFIRCVQAEDNYLYYDGGNFSRKPQSPMLCLLKSLREQPKTEEFDLDFHIFLGCSHQGRVNYNRHTGQLYLQCIRPGGWTKLMVYSNVTPQKLQQCYRSSNRRYLFTSDNFELLPAYGCPGKLINARLLAPGQGS